MQSKNRRVGSDASRQRPASKVARILRSVRFRVVLLLLVPLASLWVFAASSTLNDGLNMLHFKTVQDHFGYPAGALGSALEQERRLSLVFLGSKSNTDRSAMESSRLVTDRQASLFRRLTSSKSAYKTANAQTREWTNQIIGRLDSLHDRRQAIDFGNVGRAQIFTDYTTTIGDINAMLGALSTLNNSDVARDTKVQVELANAREVLSQEDALLSGMLAAGRPTPAERTQFTELVGTHRYLYAQTAPDLRDPDRDYYIRITSTRQYARLKNLEDRFTRRVPSGKALGDIPVVWKTTVDSVLTRFRGMELSATSGAQARINPIATGILLRVALTGGLGLLAVAVPLAMSIWVARSVVRQLGAVRRAALELANERLPSVIERLRRGETVDAAAEAPPLKFGTEEIDQVGQAFNVARWTAIQSAIEEAALRRSFSEVYINLARRNQTLVQRQLTLLDAMERRVSEPDELEDLFRLDHLATRMRRHADGLIILGGQTPGRGWRKPVPVVDVVRAAAAEVEDYARVTVTPMPRFAIHGPAVADLIHLLAELIENATLFSPPDTAVQVTGQTVGHGFAIEVEDRGLSMDPERLAMANERLSKPPEFDPADSAQIGLFVVSRLAQRHNIEVTLRKSPYGGTTAIVLLPEQIVLQTDPQRELSSGQGRDVQRSDNMLVSANSRGAPSYAYGAADTGPVRPPLEERPFPPQRNASPPPQLLRPLTDSEGMGGPAGRPSLPQRHAPRPAEEPEDHRPSERTGPMPAQTGPMPAQAGPTPPAQTRPSVFQPADETSDESPLTSGRPALPRRVRQASLAPQLREEAHVSLDDMDAERSPEEHRNLMSSIQKGWLRGRSDAERTVGDHQEEDM